MSRISLLQRIIVPGTVLGLCASLGLTGCSSNPQGGGGYGPYATRSSGETPSINANTGTGEGAPVVFIPGSPTGTSRQGSSSTTGQQGSASATEQQNQGSQNQINLSSMTSTNMVIPLYQEQAQVNKEVVNNGQVVLQKRVTTQTINRPVQLQTEHVTVNRVPASEVPQTAENQSQPFQERQIVIPLQKEEAVVQKQIVPNGAIVVKVQPSTTQSTVQAQVRHEEIAVNKSGNAANVTIAPDVNTAPGPSSGMGASSEPGGQSQGSAAAPAKVITDPQTIITATDPANLAGRQVTLTGVPVQQVIGNNLVVLGPPGATPIYARLNQPAQGIKPGDTVSLSGTIEQVPASMESLNLSADASQALRNQPVYIDAKQIATAQTNGANGQETSPAQQTNQ